MPYSICVSEASLVVQEMVVPLLVVLPAFMFEMTGAVVSDKRVLLTSLENPLSLPEVSIAVTAKK